MSDKKKEVVENTGKDDVVKAQQEEGKVPTLPNKERPVFIYNHEDQSHLFKEIDRHDAIDGLETVEEAVENSYRGQCKFNDIFPDDPKDPATVKFFKAEITLFDKPYTAYASAHQFGFAVDYVPRVLRGIGDNARWQWYWPESEHDDWKVLAELAAEAGLRTPIVWDKPHVEHPFWRDVRNSL